MTVDFWGLEVSFCLNWLRISETQLDTKKKGVFFYFFEEYKYFSPGLSLPVFYKVALIL